MAQRPGERGELVADIARALREGDTNRAVYLLITHVYGGLLTEECVIAHPEQGDAVAYLVPAAVRRTLITAADVRVMGVDAKALRSE